MGVPASFRAYPTSGSGGLKNASQRCPRGGGRMPSRRVPLAAHRLGLTGVLLTVALAHHRRIIRP
jgi:hypothetical protein